MKVTTPQEEDASGGDRGAKVSRGPGEDLGARRLQAEEEAVRLLEEENELRRRRNALERARLTKEETRSTTVDGGGTGAEAETDRGTLEVRPARTFPLAPVDGRRRVCVGCSGSVAAVKTAQLVRELVETHGIFVDLVLTDAGKFFQSVTYNGSQGWTELSRLGHPFASPAIEHTWTSASPSQPLQPRNIHGPVCMLDSRSYGPRMVARDAWSGWTVTNGTITVQSGIRFSTSTSPNGTASC